MIYAVNLEWNDFVHTKTCTKHTSRCHEVRDN